MGRSLENDWQIVAVAAKICESAISIFSQIFAYPDRRFPKNVVDFLKPLALTMNIREQLLVELSHFNIHYVADAIGTDPDHFDAIMQMVLKDKDPVPPRAAWVAELVTLKDPALMEPYLGKIIKELENYTHPGTRRNILKILMRTKIPEEYQGLLIDICFRWISDDEKKVATKVFAMQIIENHLPEYPELAVELSEVIRDQFHRNSAGFKSRGKKVLKNLEKYL